jgi:hypothetical protein
VEATRPPHPQVEIEMVLATAESLGLMVTYHRIGFGGPCSQAGWFRIHCLRGCHDAARIDANKVDPITARQFNLWIGIVMSEHDKADIEGS